MLLEDTVLNLHQVYLDPFGDGQDIDISEVPNLLVDLMETDCTGLYEDDIKLLDIYVEVMTQCADTYWSILNDKNMKKYQDTRLNNLKRDIQDYLLSLIHI